MLQMWHPCGASNGIAVARGTSDSILLLPASGTPSHYCCTAPVCSCALFNPWLCRIRYQYDGANSDGDECKIIDYNAGVDCEISFSVTEDIPGPAYVYYELTNFYQNHAT